MLCKIYWTHCVLYILILGVISVYFNLCQETGYRYSTDEMFEQVRVVASIKCRWPLHPGYMHSFGMTEHYFVIVEQPLSISLSTAMMNRFNGDPLFNALKWFPNCLVSTSTYAGKFLFRVKKVRLYLPTF